MYIEFKYEYVYSETYVKTMCSKRKNISYGTI